MTISRIVYNVFISTLVNFKVTGPKFIRHSGIIACIGVAIYHFVLKRQYITVKVVLGKYIFGTKINWLP